MLNLAQAGKSYFGHSLSDDEFEALAEAGLVHRGADVRADERRAKSAPASEANQVAVKTPPQPYATADYTAPPASVDGVPAGAWTGNWRNLPHPAVNMALNDEAALEGERYRQRVASEQPRMRAVDGNVFGFPLEAAALPPVEIPGEPVDYRGMLANDGKALGGRNALNDYDRMQAVRNQQPVQPMMPQFMAGPSRDTMAPPALSPMEEYDRSKRASDFLRDTALFMNPATGPAYAGWTAADLASRVPGQIREGDTRNALLGAGGALLAATGMVPGGGMVRGAAREAAAAGRPRLMLNPDGSPVTRSVSEPGGWTATRAVTETPGTSLNIFAGPKAATADKNALLTAMGMDSAKRTPEEIWNSTGWFRGADGKWRFEIPDNEAKLGNMREFQQGSFANSFENPGYEAAYGAQPGQPVFRGMWGPGVSKRGEYEPAAGKPGEPYYASPYMIADAQNAEGVRSVALHEQQHHIQHTEGFATGADAKVGGFNQYHRQAGEVEARNVQARADMTPEQRRGAPPWTTEDVAREQQIVRQPGGTTLGTFVGMPFGPDRERAIAMHMAGANNPDIYRETGASFGPEGALVHEISDAGATVNPASIGHGFQGTFGDVLNHPEAYKAMPGIERTPVTMSADRDFRSNMNGSARLNIKGDNADTAHVRKDMLGFLQYASGQRNNLAAGSGYQGGTQQLSDTIGSLERLQRQFARDGASTEAKQAVGAYLDHLQSLRADYVKGLTTGDPAQSMLLAASREKSKDLTRKLDHAFYDLSAGGYTKRIAGQHSETPQNALAYPWASGQLRNEPSFENMVVLPGGEAMRSPIDLLNFAVNWHKHRGAR